MKFYNCKNCGKESPISHRKMNVYCCHQCSIDDRPNKTLQRFIGGLISDRDTLRKMLSNTVGYNCSVCRISDWQEAKITLQVDHIDGNAENNMPSNLRLICPNCHTQTLTFGNDGKGSRYKKNTKRNSYLRDYKCLGA